MSKTQRRKMRRPNWAGAEMLEARRVLTATVIDLDLDGDRRDGVIIDRSKHRPFGTKRHVKSEFPRVKTRGYLPSPLRGWKTRNFKTHASG